MGRRTGVASPAPGTREFATECRRLDRRPPTYRLAKRAFDVVFSAFVIAVGIIPCLLLAAAIALDTKGSPLYSQIRAGRNGLPFRLYKFRSMVADADNVEKYLTKEQLAAWKRERKVCDDPRVTRLGRFIRKTSLDELPQFINVLLGNISVIGPRFINVLLGNISVIGPRPITYDELAEFGNDVALLLSVEPGITGAWQCGPRNEASFDNGRRQAIELGYVRDACVRLDATIFFSTFRAMFGRRTGI